MAEEGVKSSIGIASESQQVRTGLLLGQVRFTSLYKPVKVTLLLVFS